MFIIESCKQTFFLELLIIKKYIKSFQNGWPSWAYCRSRVRRKLSTGLQTFKKNLMNIKLRQFEY